MNSLDNALNEYSAIKKINAKDIKMLKRLNNFILERSEQKQQPFETFLIGLDPIDTLKVNLAISEALKDADFLSRDRYTPIKFRHNNKSYELQRCYYRGYLFLEGLKAANLDKRNHAITNDFVETMLRSQQNKLVKKLS